MHSSKNIATGLTTFIAGMLLVGCGQNPSDAAGAKSLADEDGVVKSDIVLGKVGVLAKVAAIDLRTVRFTLVSSTGDTLRDSATASGSGQVILTKTWTLKPLRNWTIHAKSHDAKDSVIHTGYTASFRMDPADTVSVNLSLASRFTMYEARFQDLPDSISSTVSGTGKAKVNLSRVTLKVDDVIRADSLKANYFAGNQAVTLFYDYITVGSHTVVLEASGKLNDFEGVLYRGTATFNVASGSDETRTVVLEWVGPTTGTGTLTVTLGRVGKVLVNGTLPGAVIQ
ncbi:MAG TPA: hypothetical protein VK465_02505 [Fibrobacteria bacterium]|nr:hypothetical protein [Fibrobacteria bacterium]